MKTNATESEVFALAAERIVRRRKELRLGQAVVAELSGISRSYLCDIERGRAKKPTMGVYVAIANTLDVPVSYLVGDPIGKTKEVALELRRLTQVVGELASAVCVLHSMMPNETADQ